MNTDRAENLCSDDCSQSVNSTTSSSSSQEDLVWDNYSPPLRTFTDECSCTPSASHCTSCGRLTSCHSCAGGPCSSLKSWPESKITSSRDRSQPSSSAWFSNRGCVRRDETDSLSMMDDELKSIESPSCSRASRLVSASQDGVLEASIVLSGRPSSASIDFRRKCTAYWDGVRSLQSLTSSTGCPTEAMTTADTCTSAYSLLSMPNSDSSHQSALRIFQSFRVSDGTVRVDRISLARTLRPHSADDICRLRIASDQEKRSRDDDPTGGHRAKRICSAVQFSQIVTTHCYDNEFSYHTALPVHDCDAIIHADCEDHEEHKERRGNTSIEDDECNQRCEDLPVPGDNAESEHAGDKDCINSGQHQRHHSSHGHRSKQHRDYGQSTKEQRDRDQPCEDHADQCRQQCSRGRHCTDHNEDSLNYQDQIDCCQSCRDNKDQRHHSRNHNDTQHHTCTMSHPCCDSIRTDLCHDSKDQQEHVHHVKQHDNHCHDSKDQHELVHHVKQHDDQCHGPKDHNEHRNRVKDHSEDHDDQRHRSREHTDSNKHRGEKHQCRNYIDSRHDLPEPSDRGHHVKDNSDLCPDSKDHIDHGHRSREHRDGFRESRGQSDHFHHRRDNWSCCCDSTVKTGHECNRRDLENSSHDSIDQNVDAHSKRDHVDSHASRDNVEHGNQSKGRSDNRHRFGNLDPDCVQYKDSDRRSSDSQSSDSYLEDQSCIQDCTCKMNHNERKGYKNSYKKFRDSHQTDKDQYTDRRRHKDCFRPHNDNEVHFRDEQDQRHSDGVKRKKDNSTDEILSKDLGFKNYKEFERYRTGFNCDTESDLDVYVKELRRRQFRFLEETGCYPDFMRYEEEQESEEKKKQIKKRNENAENEVWEEKMETKYKISNECNVGSITDLLILGYKDTKPECQAEESKYKDTEPERQAEEIQIDINFRFCEFPEVIPPLEYFQGRAVVSIEGNLDELPQNASPMLYKPQPVPLRSPTPQPTREMFPIEPVPELKSTQSFEPRLELPAQSQRTPSRISAQVAPSIITAQPAVYMPGKLSRTPVVAFQSTVEGDRKPTSIRGKAENMPAVCRLNPMQMGDLADVGHIEPLCKKQSCGLKPELVCNGLEKIASLRHCSFIGCERRMPSKTVGWVERVSPIPPIAPDSAAAASFDDGFTSDFPAANAAQDRYSPIDPRIATQNISSSPENMRSRDSPESRISSVPAKSTLRSILVGSRMQEENRVSSSMAGGGTAYSTPGGGTPYSMPGGGTPYSMPGGGAPYSMPGGGTPYSMPGGGAPYSMPGGGTPYSMPGGGTPYSMPGGGTPYSTPGGGTASPMPGGGGTASPMPGGGGTASPMPGGGGTASPMPGGGGTASPMPGGGGTASPMPGGGRVSSTPRRSRVSSTAGGGRLSSFSYGRRLTSYDESDSYAYPEHSQTSIGPEDARYSIIPDFERNRHSFGYSHRRTTIHLNRQSKLNPNGLIISHFNPQPQILVAAPELGQEDIYYLDPSSTEFDIIPAIQDITVHIPSQTETPPQPAKPPKRDDSELICLKELLAVPLSGQKNSDSEISADSNGQLCKTSSRSSDPGLDISTSGVAAFSEPQRQSKRPLLNLYPSENCLCTSVTQIVSRSTKHGTKGENETCAAMRDKRSQPYRSKWYRSLSSKTIHDTPSEGSIPDRNSSASETRSEACHASRTSTWVDCYTLPGSEMRHHPPETCTDHHPGVDECGQEMGETSSCTDSVTTIYTRLPTSSARHRSLHRCTLATEPCHGNCFTGLKRCCEEFEQRPVHRNCRQTSPAANVSCAHCCPTAGDRIVSSTVVASRRHHRCKTDDWNDGGRLREQTFERKYKALKRFCIETLGCVPPPTTSMCFE